MALASTSQLNWLVRMIGTMGADMNSVERILHYTHNIDHEEVPEMDRLVDELRETNTEGSDVTATVLVEGVSGGSEGQHPGRRRGGWSSARWKCGTVRGCRLWLDRVSFRIEPRQKVGVVGRTGSGKSTLLLTLMRMVDICGGDIIVSGRPICAYGLRELRQQFSMIPQDPVLFDARCGRTWTPSSTRRRRRCGVRWSWWECGSVWSWRAAASTAACRRAGRTTAWASGSCCAWRVRCCGGAAASSRWTRPLPTSTTRSTSRSNTR
ncbi:putative multidrug resistance protein E [Trypanosoma cruzi]|uniref:Putative multidrug resistance protein E n=1 Tax=Trypanosoma cruzi TaxID=5693 RepID=A0A2V2VT20_TRYCR|nr:putative multidrug resistance protein E [Trypanosoma cruzi]